MGQRQGTVALADQRRRRFGHSQERASIVVFATHSLDMLPRFCERTLLLRKGRIVADGPTADVVQLYSQGSVTAPGAESPT